jgi:2-hydroxychromene-2-carboxylate isomerase
MLWAQHSGEAVFRRYHETVFDRFWRRELDIESVPAITDVLDEVGALGFPAWADQGRAEVANIVVEAEAQGVFGVPSFIVNNELFWGREHLPDIRAMLANPA